MPRFRVCSTCNYENCVCFTATGDRYTCERRGQILAVIARARFIDVNVAITVLAVKWRKRRETALESGGQRERTRKKKEEDEEKGRGGKIRLTAGNFFALYRRVSAFRDSSSRARRTFY